MSRIEAWVYIIIFSIFIYVGLMIAADSIRNKEYPEPMYVQEEVGKGLFGIKHYRWYAIIDGRRHDLKRKLTLNGKEFIEQ